MIVMLEEKSLGVPQDEKTKDERQIEIRNEGYSMFSQRKEKINKTGIIRKKI